MKKLYKAVYVRGVLLLSVCILFSSGSGAQPTYVWAKNAGAASDDLCYDIVVDLSGNVYVTGYFWGTADFDPGGATAILSSAGFTDIFFAKYDANGDYLWARRAGSTDYDYGNSIAVDGTGNVFITGQFIGTADFDPGAGTVNLTSAGGSTDIFFAKYDASGMYLWAKRIGNTDEDYGHDISVDGSGTVFITGEFTGTADFDPGAGAANLTATGGSFDVDIFFARYDAGGNYNWARNVGSAGSDVGYSLAVDGSGNVHVTGYYSSTADFDPGAGTVSLTVAGGSDIFFAKYNSSGDFVWAKGAGSNPNNDFGYSIAVDGSGNVYVAGNFGGTADFDPGAAGTANLTTVSSSYDLYFAKYDVGGNYLWAKSVGSASNDVSWGIAVDGSGNVYVTGGFGGVFGLVADFDPSASTANLTSAGNQDIFMAKYNSSGNYLWAVKIGNANYDVGRGITLGGSCDVYIAGGFGGGSGGTTDFDPGGGTANLTSAGAYDAFFAQYGCGALPMELLSFYAELQNDHTALLYWSAAETGEGYFTIERSVDGSHFGEAGTAGGTDNIHSAMHYKFADTLLPSLLQWGDKAMIFYRLRRTGYDGRYIYSKVIPLAISDLTALQITRLTMIAVHIMQITFNLPGNREVNPDIEFYDLTGRKVLEKDLGRFEKGIHTRQVDVAMLPAGIYGIVLRAGQETVYGKLLLY